MIDSATAEINARWRKALRCAEALIELVELRAMKEVLARPSVDKGLTPEALTKLRADYGRRKPLAWAEAQAAVKAFGDARPAGYIARRGR